MAKTLASGDGWEVTEFDFGATIEVQLCYPRNSRAKRIEVGLSDVRAADSIRVEYDFERDGWVIKQASRFSWAADEIEKIEDAGGDPSDWQEVAFVQSWARKVDDGRDG